MFPSFVYQYRIVNSLRGTAVVPLLTTLKCGLIWLSLGELGSATRYWTLSVGVACIMVAMDTPAPAVSMIAKTLANASVRPRMLKRDLQLKFLSNVIFPPKVQKGRLQ